MDEQPSLSAARQARYKDSLADRGVKQVNILAPADTHAALKEIARRTRAGEDLTRVLYTMSQAIGGKSLGKLEMRDERLANALAALPPSAEGMVNITVALADRASGSIRRKLKEAGLVYENQTYSGPVPVETVDYLRQRVEATGGAMLTA